MKTLFLRLFLILLPFFSSSLAEAQTVKRMVPPNRSTIVGFFNVLTNDHSTCQQPQRPIMQVVDQPLHGHVAFRWARHSWPKMREACKGVGIGGMEIIYTPAKGYHGFDRFKIGAQYAQYQDVSGWSYGSGSYILKVR